MSDLYIIGNGFDLAHKLPTNYNPDLLQQMGKIDKELTDAITKLYFGNDPELWSEFEQRVGVVDTFVLDDMSSELEDRLQEHQENKDVEIEYFGIDDERYGDEYSAIYEAMFKAETQMANPEELVSGTPLENMHKFADVLREGFQRMVARADNVEIIPEFLRLLHSGEKFVTFNYTNTLERVYDIPDENILHIHGKLGEEVWGNESDEIEAQAIPIDFFSDLDYKNHQLEPDLAGMKPDEIVAYNHRYEDRASNYGDYEKAFDEPADLFNEYLETLNGLNAQFVKEYQIDELSDWIATMRNTGIDRIIVLGHSLGKVDVPYFQVINSAFPEAKWIVSYYNEKDPVLINVKQIPLQNRFVMIQSDYLKRFDV